MSWRHTYLRWRTVALGVGQANEGTLQTICLAASVVCVSIASVVIIGYIHSISKRVSGDHAGYLPRVPHGPVLSWRYHP